MNKIEILKKETNNPLKKSWKTQGKKINKTAQDLKLKTESIMKTQPEEILEIKKKIGILTRTTKASFANRIQKMKERTWVLKV